MCDDALVRCERCEEPTLYFRLTRLADDERRHAALFRCPDCGSLYEIHPEVKEQGERLSVAEAALRFPGAV